MNSIFQRKLRQIPSFKVIEIIESACQRHVDKKKSESTKASLTKNELYIRARKEETDGEKGRKLERDESKRARFN